MEKCYCVVIGARVSVEHTRQIEDDIMYKNQRRNNEAQSSLYRQQNKSIVVTMVWLIGITALVLGVVVMASELGLF